MDETNCKQGRPQADACASSKFAPQFNFLCNFTNDSTAVKSVLAYDMLSVINNAVSKAFDASGHRRIALAFDRV